MAKVYLIIANMFIIASQFTAEKFVNQDVIAGAGYLVIYMFADYRESHPKVELEARL